jgi:hypothetical protein
MPINKHNKIRLKVINFLLLSFIEENHLKGIVSRDFLPQIFSAILSGGKWEKFFNRKLFSYFVLDCIELIEFTLKLLTYVITGVKNAGVKLTTGIN